VTKPIIRQHFSIKRDEHIIISHLRSSREESNWGEQRP